MQAHSTLAYPALNCSQWDLIMLHEMSPTWAEWQCEVWRLQGNTSIRHKARKRGSRKRKGQKGRLLQDMYGQSVMDTEIQENRNEFWGYRWNEFGDYKCKKDKFSFIIYPLKSSVVILNILNESFTKAFPSVVWSKYCHLNVSQKRYYINLYCLHHSRRVERVSYTDSNCHNDYNNVPMSHAVPHANLHMPSAFLQHAAVSAEPNGHEHTVDSQSCSHSTPCNASKQHRG